MCLRVILIDIPIATIPTTVQETVPTLTVGEHAEPIREGDSVYIVKVTAIKGADPQLQTLVHARHILLKPNLIRNDAQTRLQLRGIRQRIVAGADFADEAFLHTEDTASRQEGGDLGWKTYDTFVPRFTQALQSLAIGDISEPFVSQFGWHIAQLLGQQEQDISVTQQLNLIRNYLFQQQVEDEFNRWMIELKTRAFIDVLVDVDEFAS